MGVSDQLNFKSVLEKHNRDVSAISSISNKNINYSLVNHIQASLGLSAPNGSDGVFSEDENIRNISGQNPNGVWMSLTRLAKRDLAAGSQPGGGYTVGNKHDGNLIEVLRPASAAIDAGATFVTGLNQGNLILPRVSSSVSVGWVGENVNANASQQSFDQVVIVPRTVSVVVNVTKQLLKASSVVGGSSMSSGLEEALKKDIFNALFQEIDRVCLAGSGIGDEPSGILNQPSVPVVVAGTNGAAPSWSLLADIEHQVANRKDSTSQHVSFVTNSSVRKKLRNTQRGTGLDYIWTDSNSVMGRLARVTDSVPSNYSKGTSNGVCSAIIAGDFSDAIIGFWGPAAVDIVIDKVSFGKNGIVRIVALADVGIGLRHEGSFAVCKDILTS